MDNSVEIYRPGDGIENCVLSANADATINEIEPLRGEHLDQIRALAAASIKASTSTVYDAAWRVWREWCQQYSYVEFPASENVVAAFMADMLQSRKPATVRRYLATICAKHSRAGIKIDRRHTAIRAVLDGSRNIYDCNQREAAPLMADDVLTMVSEFGDRVTDYRDRMTILLGVASGCRRSELVCLDWSKRGGGTGVIAKVDGGLLIELFDAKTARGKSQFVTVADGPAVDAVLSWIERAGIMPGEAVFRSVDRFQRVGGRLSGQSIGLIVKRRCKAAGLDPAVYSGHSLRSGAATSAYDAGVAEIDIQRHLRHSSLQTRKYYRPHLRAARSINRQLGI